VAKSRRKQKLKVFRTPIGFHDAYVAAPSQKAALEAWGSDTNLFASGAAEQVTDPALAKVPLEHPGQVVKVLRGSEEEQLAALERQAGPKRRAPARAEILPKRAKKRPPKPKRAALARAEQVMDKLQERHERQREALERKRREMLRRQERERDSAQERVESEREKYEAALAHYESG